MRTTEDVVNRLRAAFLQMPRLRLTPEHVQRLCGIEHMICQIVLDLLVNEQFLCGTSDGQYARPTGDHPQPARAERLSGRRIKRVS